MLFCLIAPSSVDWHWCQSGQLFSGLGHVTFPMQARDYLDISFSHQQRALQDKIAALWDWCHGCIHLRNSCSRNGILIRIPCLDKCGHMFREYIIAKKILALSSPWRWQFHVFLFLSRYASKTGNVWQEKSIQGTWLCVVPTWKCSITISAAFQTRGTPRVLAV